MDRNQKIVMLLALLGITLAGLSGVAVAGLGDELKVATEGAREEKDKRHVRISSGGAEQNAISYSGAQQQKRDDAWRGPANERTLKGQVDAMVGGVSSEDLEKIRAGIGRGKMMFGKGDDLTRLPARQPAILRGPAHALEELGGYAAQALGPGTQVVYNPLFFKDAGALSSAPTARKARDSESCEVQALEHRIKRAEEEVARSKDLLEAMKAHKEALRARQFDTTAWI